LDSQQELADRDFADNRGSRVSLSKVVSRGLWLYINQVVFSVLGFVYWFVISALAGSKAVGVASSVMGLASILSNAVNMGMPESIKRYIGKSLGERDERSLREFFWSAFSYMVFSLAGVSILVFILSLTGRTIYGLQPSMLIFVSILISLSFSAFFVGFLTACLETQYITYSSIISNLSRLCVGVTLVVLGLQWVGATLGLVIGSAANLMLLFYFSTKLISRYKVGFKPVPSLSATLELIRAGVVRWAPTFLLILGQWMGLLSIYEIHGEAASGHYYIAFAIYSVILSFPLTFISLMLPILSGMKNGRRRAILKVTRISLVLAGVLSPTLYYYSKIPLSLIGKDYEVAHRVLSLLSLNLIPMTLVSAVNIFAYASGLYLTVLMLGLATNLPRILLYPSLVSAQGSSGAALSYLFGTFLGLITSIAVSLKVDLKIPFLEVILVSFIGFSIFYIISILPIPWMIALILAMTLVMVTYIKLKLLTLNDVREIMVSILPQEYIKKLYPLARPLMKMLFGEY